MNFQRSAQAKSVIGGQGIERSAREGWVPIPDARAGGHNQWCQSESESSEFRKIPISDLEFGRTRAGFVGKFRAMQLSPIIL